MVRLRAMRRCELLGAGKKGVEMSDKQWIPIASTVAATVLAAAVIAAVSSMAGHASEEEMTAGDAKVEAHVVKVEASVVASAEESRSRDIKLLERIEASTAEVSDIKANVSGINAALQFLVKGYDGAKK